MARPWQHPKTGIFWLRRAVPDDLRALVGKREEKLSLRTRDQAEARRLHTNALAEVEARWKALREGARSLSEREAHDIAREVHDGWLARYREEPSQQTFWSLDIGRKVFNPQPLDMDKLGTPEILALDPHIGRITTLQEWCTNTADYALNARGLIVDEGSRHKLARAIAAAVQRASEVLVRLSKGEIEPSSQAPVDVSQSASKDAAVSRSAKAVSFDDLVKGWSAEKKPAFKTVY